MWSQKLFSEWRRFGEGADGPRPNLPAPALMLPARRASAAADARSMVPRLLLLLRAGAHRRPRGPTAGVCWGPTVMGSFTSALPLAPHARMPAAPAEESMGASGLVQQQSAIGNFGRRQAAPPALLRPALMGPGGSSRHRPHQQQTSSRQELHVWQRSAAA